MNELSKEVKHSLLLILDEFYQETYTKASSITLLSLVDSKPLIRELFAQNCEEFLYLTIAQRITTSFSSRFKNVVLNFSQVLIEAQGGSVIKYPEPYDLKFQLKDGLEYWIDIKHINDQKSYAFSHNERKIKAESSGKIYKLCLYEEPGTTSADFQLNCDDYWALVAGFEQAKNDLYALMRGSANHLSLSTLVEDTRKRLMREWRMQE